MRELASEVARLEDATFGDDGSDQGGRGDVEGGIENFNTGRGK